jgi:hypothetical protein
MAIGRARGGDGRKDQSGSANRSRRNCAGDPRSFGDHWRSRSVALISFDMEQARGERDWRQARRAALGPRDDGLRGRCAE